MALPTNPSSGDQANWKGYDWVYDGSSWRKVLKAQQHDELLERNTPGQHTIDAITGLREALDEGGTVSDEQISQAIADYLAANPLEDVIQAGMAVQTTDAASWESEWPGLAPYVPAGVKVITEYADGQAALWTRGSSGNAFIDETPITTGANLGKLVVVISNSVGSEAPWVRFVSTPDGGATFGLDSLPLSPKQAQALADTISALNLGTASSHAEEDFAAATHDHDGAYQPKGELVATGTDATIGVNVTAVWAPDATSPTITLPDNGLTTVTIVSGRNSGVVTVKNSEGSTIATLTVDDRVGDFICLGGSIWERVPRPAVLPDGQPQSGDGDITVDNDTHYVYTYGSTAQTVTLPSNGRFHVALAHSGNGTVTVKTLDNVTVDTLVGTDPGLQTGLYACGGGDIWLKIA